MFPFIWDGFGMYMSGWMIALLGLIVAVSLKSNGVRVAVVVITAIFAVTLTVQSFTIVDHAEEKRGAAVAAYLSKNYSLKVESNEDAYKLTKGEAITVTDKNGKTLEVTMPHPESAHPKLQVQDVKILQQNR